MPQKAGYISISTTIFREESSMKTVELQVQGMSCSACVKHVTEALHALDGVSEVETRPVEAHKPMGTAQAQHQSGYLLPTLRKCNHRPSIHVASCALDSGWHRIPEAHPGRTGAADPHLPGF